MLSARKNALIGVVVGVLATCFVIAMWSASSCDPREIAKRTSAYQQSHKETCDAFKISPLKGVGILLSNSINEISTGLTAIATGFIAWFTIILAGIGRRQSEDSRAVQRAHVFVWRPESELLMHPKGEIYGARLKVIWKNSGATPADHIHALVGTTWVNKAEDFTFGANGVVHPFVLGPGAEIESIPTQIGNPLAFLNHQGHTFFWGIVNYRDVFPKSRNHVVEFCFRVTYEGTLGLPPNNGRIHFALHPAHNCYYDA
ncbi:MAG: hypothetical protein WA268_21720 [Xanthobacteraceae bacterium]